MSWTKAYRLAATVSFLLAVFEYQDKELLWIGIAIFFMLGAIYEILVTPKQTTTKEDFETLAGLQ